MPGPPGTQPATQTTQHPVKLHVCCCGGKLQIAEDSVCSGLGCENNAQLFSKRHNAGPPRWRLKLFTALDTLHRVKLIRTCTVVAPARCCSQQAASHYPGPLLAAATLQVGSSTCQYPHWLHSLLCPHSQGLRPLSSLISGCCHWLRKV